MKKKNAGYIMAFTHPITVAKPLRLDQQSLNLLSRPIKVAKIIQGSSHEEGANGLGVEVFNPPGQPYRSLPFLQALLPAQVMNAHTLPQKATVRIANSQA